MRNAWILTVLVAGLTAVACGTEPTEALEPTATPTWQQWLGQQIAGGRCGGPDHTMEYSNENRTPPYSADFICMAATPTTDAVATQVAATVTTIMPAPGTRGIIEPSGSANLTSSSTVSCDEVFKNQLVRQQAAGNADRMSQVKVQVQQRQNECASEVWDPTIMGRGDVFTADPSHGWSPSPPVTSPVSCHEANRSDDSDASRGSIGGLAVPRGLVRFTGGTTLADIGSGRDGENNIILFFSNNNDFRPSDGAPCWMYVERFGSWVSGSQRYVPR